MTDIIKEGDVGHFRIAKRISDEVVDVRYYDNSKPPEEGYRLVLAEAANTPIVVYIDSDNNVITEGIGLYSSCTIQRIRIRCEGDRSAMLDEIKATCLSGDDLASKLEDLRNTIIRSWFS